MPRLSEAAFRRVPLRVHALLAGIALHDAWTIDLPSRSGGITLVDFLRESDGHIQRPSPLVRALLRLRFALGRELGWDRLGAKSRGDPPSFADRLTADDRTRSIMPPGAPQGAFQVVYRFENEQLLELTNHTVHAAALNALEETPMGYRFYLAVYVQNVSPLTPLYMAAIDPVRRLIVYPSLLRSARAQWERTMGADETRAAR